MKPDRLEVLARHGGQKRLIRHFCCLTSQSLVLSAPCWMETAVWRRGDEGRSVRDDGGDQASRSPWTWLALPSSHQDPSPCQWFSRLAALDRRSGPQAHPAAPRGSPRPRLADGHIKGGRGRDR